jgi:hypothetical protein
MAEDGIPEILQADRMGHSVPGIRGVYSHVSDRMRTELVEALQRRWEHALAERFAMSPSSPVGVLNRLLEAYREAPSGATVLPRAPITEPRMLRPRPRKAL